MSDTVRRKDVVHPAGDSHKPNGDQFNNRSTETSPSNSTHNTSEQSGSIVSISNTTLRVDKGSCQSSSSIQIGVGNGFSSEDSEDSDTNITMSTSCGQAELRNLKSEAMVAVRRNSGGSTNDHKYLAGKVVEIPSDEDDIAVDKRVQSTYSLFSKGNLKSKRQISTKSTLNVQQKEPAIKSMGVGAPGTTWRRTPSPNHSKSNHSSPTHTTHLQAESFVKLRSPSPEVGKRVQSNPFFQQDRDRMTASRTIVNALKARERNRLGSAPTNVMSTFPTEPNSSSADVSAMKGHKGKSFSKSQSSVLLDVFPTSGVPADDVEPQISNKEKSKGTSVDVNRRHSTETTTKVPLDAAVAVNIQSRIKLWAEKEKEAKAIQIQEEQDKRHYSVGVHKQKEQHAVKEDGTTMAQSENLTSDVAKSSKVTEPSVRGGNQQTVKYEKIPLQDKDETKKVTGRGNKEGYSSSSSLGSPSRSPIKGSRSRSSSKGSKDSSNEELSPKKSRWKLRSPLLNRKRNTDSESTSMDSEQSDENTLSSKMGNRSGKKRKAIKKRLSSTFAGILRSNSDAKHVQDKKSKTSDDIPTTHQEVVKEAMQRSNSVGASSRRRVNVNNKQKTVSQPDISRMCVNHTPPNGDGGTHEDEVYMVIRSKQLDPETERFTGTGNVPNGSPRQNDTQIHNQAIDTAERDTVAELPSVFIRQDKGRKIDVEDRTISRDIRDIIDSLGTESLVHKDSELIKTTITEVAELEEASQLESTLPPNNPLDVFVEPPTDDCVGVGTGSLPPRVSSPNELYISGDSGSDVEESKDDDNCSLQSSLDIGPRKRALIKRRLSDSSKAIMSTKLSSPKIPYQPRTTSLSPTPDDPSDGVIATSLMYADAVWDRLALEDDELSFGVGDAIEILDMTDDVWWYGSVDASNGWFPASFVRLRIGQDSDEDDDSIISTDPSTPPPSPPLPEKHETSQTTPTPDEPPKQETMQTFAEDRVLELSTKAVINRRHTTSRQQSGTVHRRMTIRRKDSTPSQPRKLTSAEVRAKVIEEILNTERDYVKHLEDIIEGYVKRCKGYNKLFDEDKCDTIFSNVEQIYAFQKDFLRELETGVQHDRLEDSQIGEVFVTNRHEFDIYCQYCNNHPHAVNEMNMLQENEQYTFFFESCRLLRNLQDISLEGFLLTPVQKICKYPLQLSELLKYTSEDHPDYQHVVAARDAMKEVAMHINEQKRRMENIGKIGRWQGTIDGWKGEDILEKSSQMLRCGELHKISKGRSQERHFFLFDHQLIYCKKDTIGGKLTFKGRVSLDQCQVTDVDEGSAMHGGTVVKNAWRMNNKAKDNKWYIIFARSPEEKRDWLNAFKKEREMVKEDKDTRFHIPLKMKRAAVSLCDNADKLRRRRKSVPAKSRTPLVESVDSGTRHKVELFSNNTLGRKLAVSTGSSPIYPHKKSGKANKKKRAS